MTDGPFEHRSSRRAVVFEHACHHCRGRCFHEIVRAMIRSEQRLYHSAYRLISSTGSIKKVAYLIWFTLQRRVKESLDLLQPGVGFVYGCFFHDPAERFGGQLPRLAQFMV